MYLLSLKEPNGRVGILVFKVGGVMSLKGYPFNPCFIKLPISLQDELKCGGVAEIISQSHLSPYFCVSDCELIYMLQYYLAVFLFTLLSQRFESDRTMSGVTVLDIFFIVSCSVFHLCFLRKMSS